MRRLLLLGGAAAAVAVLAVILLSSGTTKHKVRRLVPAAGNGDASYDPLGYADSKRKAFETNAAGGLAHVLYAHSPGGVLATAARVDAFRPMIVKAAKAGGVDPDILEAIVFLESAGRPEVMASNSLRGAVGLTQILAQTATGLLGMHVDLTESRRLTKLITRHPSKAAKYAAQRRNADQRFDPAASLAATVRYLNFAKGKLGGRDDLAVESYHMGVGNLQRALEAYGKGSVPYAQLFFDSTPLRNPGAWTVLHDLGDDSDTYLWRIYAAQAIMAAWRASPALLEKVAVLQVEKNSAEDVLHPPATTTRFADHKALQEAEEAGVIAPLQPAVMAAHGLRIDPEMGELASKVGGTKALYRGLKPVALATALYMGSGVRAISHDQGTLDMTSSVRDVRYQKKLGSEDIQATDAFSQHTAGYAFDISRKYHTRAQATAFQFMLDRLTAMNLIAWVREPLDIHVTVSDQASVLLPIIGLRETAGGEIVASG